MASIMGLKKTLQKLAAVLLALLVWQAAAAYINEKILLVSPIQVLKRLFTLVFEDGFLQTVSFTLLRIIGGFFAGFVLGAVLGVIAGRFKLIETLLWPYMITVKSVPVASFIVIALIWLASSKLSVFISFLMVLPIVYTNILTGIKNTDKKLVQAAKLFKLSGAKKFLFIHLPQLKPYIISACNVSIGLAWKSGVAAEVIAIPDGSLGEMLYNAKVYYDTADLFAWTVVIVIVSVAFEKLFVYGIKSIFKAVEKL